MERQKTRIEDVDRERFDFRDADRSSYKTRRGLTADIVAEISRIKDEPPWMLQKRLRSLALYNRMPLPSWGPSLDELDMDEIVAYVRPDTRRKNDWDAVPEYIKNTFERLGIPQAERESLAGRERTVRFGGGLPPHQTRACGSGCDLYGYGDSPAGARRHRQEALYEAGAGARSQVRGACTGPSGRGGSYVHVPEGVHGRHTAPVLFQGQRAGHGGSSSTP